MILSGITESFAQTSYLSVEKNEYEIKTSGEDMILVKIYGEGESGKENKKVAIIITLPDGTKDNHGIFSTSEGYFELLYPITKTSQEGQYIVFASFDTKILNQVSFEVKKVHPFEEIKRSTYAPSSSISPSTIFDEFHSDEFGLTVFYPSNWIIEESENKKMIIFADVLNVYSNRGAIVEVDYEKLIGNLSTKNQIAKKFKEVVTDVTSERLIEGTLNVIERKIIDVGDNTNYYFTTQLQVEKLNDPTQTYKSIQLHNFLVSKDKKIIFTTIEILPGDFSKVKPVADKIMSSLVLDEIIKKQEPIIASPIITEKKETPIIEQTKQIEKTTIQNNIEDKTIVEAKNETPIKKDNSGSNASGSIFLILILIIILAIIIKLRKTKSKKVKRTNFKNQYVQNRPKDTPSTSSSSITFGSAIPKQSQGSPIVNKARFINEDKNILQNQNKDETIKNQIKQAIPTPMESKNNNSVCKGKCKEFAVKKVQGLGRYGSGQVHCQICDVWLDHKGCHKKDLTPAEEDSLGIRCNCCNYQVRSKPRNKVYKEKLRDSQKEPIKIVNQKEPIERTNQNRPKLTSENIEGFINSRNLTTSQPYRSVLMKFIKLANQFPDESILKVFETRFIIGIKSKNTARNQRSIIENFENYLKLKNSQDGQDIPNEITSSNESLIDTNTINQLISDALVIIRKDSTGIYEDVLRNELNISENEFKQILPKLLRLEGMVEESEDWGDGISKKILRSIKIIEKSTPTKIKKETVKKNTESKQDKEIKDITYKMVAEHVRWKYNIDKKLKIELIDSYLKHKSMKKVYDEFSIHTKQKIRIHLTTDIRLPPKLKEIEKGGLHSNPSCSTTIALYTTDYYDWENNPSDENEEKIIDLAKSISNYLRSDINMNNIFEGKK